MESLPSPGLSSPSTNTRPNSPMLYSSALNTLHSDAPLTNQLIRFRRNSSGRRMMPSISETVPTDSFVKHTYYSSRPVFKSARPVIDHVEPSTSSEELYRNVESFESRRSSFPLVNNKSTSPMMHRTLPGPRVMSPVSEIISTDSFSEIEDMVSLLGHDLMKLDVGARYKFLQDTFSKLENLIASQEQLQRNYEYL